ncbi:helix-turn-helix domain-containing protein [Yinghuangia sp. YIM S10712]|uniref:helix-turn-helix domain-containing protein n=1 Tax=Yinghuangia sp. YIM S10712 TaxID=3436930 RepID=UPI003F534929
MAPQKDIDPTKDLWAVFRYHLRQLRHDAQLSQEALGEKVNSTGSHVGQIETGERKPHPDLVPILDRVLGARGMLVVLAAHARRLGEVRPRWFDGLIQAEQQANRIRTYEPQVIPGLLQTEGYARELFKQLRMPTEQIDADWLTRMERQQVLVRERPVEYWAVIDEAALRRLLHLSNDVVRAQLEHLLKMTELPHVTIEVLLEDVALHACMNGAFVMLTLPGRGVAVYDEGIGEGRLTTDEHIVEEVSRRYDLLRAETLSPRRSAVFLRDLLENL